MFAILLFNLIFAHALMLGVWLIYKHQKLAMIADVFWPLGIGLQAIFYSVYMPHFSPLLVLLICWSLRLSLFLYHTRLKEHHHDPRYQDIATRSQQNPNITFFINFQIQAFLQFIVASVWFFISTKHHALILTTVSALMVLTGLWIEISADKTLMQFKQQQLKGVCQLGLWRFSRHPNYFGELMIWFGFALAGSDTLFGCLGFISPFILYLIMRCITGPLSESLSLKHKGALYQDYQRSTPMIFPYKLLSSNRAK